MFKYVLALGLLAAPVVGKEVAPTLVQSRYNAQIQVQSFRDLSPRIEQLCRESGAQITNFSSDLNSSSGSLNLRVPEPRLAGLLQDLRSLGQVQNENRSVSDNTSSYLDAQRNLEAAEKTLSAHWTISGGNLNDKEKALVDAEFRAFLRDRIGSYRSSLNQYEQNRGWAEVSVNLSGPPVPSEQARHGPRHPVVAGVQPGAPPPPPPPPLSGFDARVVGMALFGPALLMLGLFSVYFLRQSRAAGRAGSGPENR